MIGLTLKHVRYFSALARHRHFGHAADDCAISQPALSMQIKELEALMDAPLVERAGRSVELTPLGQEVADRALAMLRIADEFEALKRLASKEMVGELKIGAIPTVAPYFLPKAVSAVAGAYAHLRVQPREAVTETLIADILACRLDVALVALPLSEPLLHEAPLFEESFVLVRPKADAHRPVPKVNELKEMKLLLLEEGHCFRDQALSFCEMDGTGNHTHMEGSSLATLVQMVNIGIGVTLLPEMAVPLETSSAKVCLDYCTEVNPKRSIGMIWRRSSPLSDAYAELAAFLTSLHKETFTHPPDGGHMA